MPEIARLAVSLGKVLQRGAAVPDRRRQGIAYGIDQSGNARFTDSPRRTGWTNSGQEQCFAGVNVAHADDNMAVHQYGFYRRAAFTTTLPQVVSIESFAERFRPQLS